MNGDTIRTFRSKIRPHTFLTIFVSAQIAPKIIFSSDAPNCGAPVMWHSPFASLRENQEFETDPLRGSSTVALCKI